MRILRAAVLAAAAAVLISGCGRGLQTDEDRIRSALARTAAAERAFAFVDRTVQSSVEVRGLVDDDFRYTARVSMNDVPALDQVASDDALAIRLLPSHALKGVAGGLRPGTWYVDEDGAPDPFSAETRKARVGEDPVRDALNVFAYVEEAMRQAADVVLFNEEALDYRAEDDTFPKPVEGSGTRRYDLRLPDLPTAAQVSGNEEVPGIEHFRRMSIYVRSGYVVQVLEEIDIPARLEQLERNYGTEFPKNLSRQRAAEIALDALNALRVGQGRDPIRPRSMSLEIAGIGRDNTVSIPTGARKVPGTNSFASLRPQPPQPALRATSTPGAKASPSPAPTAPALDLLGRSRAEPTIPPAPVPAGQVALWLVGTPAVLVAVAALVLKRRSPAALR